MDLSCARSRLMMGAMVLTIIVSCERSREPDWDFITKDEIRFERTESARKSLWLPNDSALGLACDTKENSVPIAEARKMRDLVKVELFIFVSSKSQIKPEC